MFKVATITISDEGAGLWISGGTLGHVSTLSFQILIVEHPLQMYIFQAGSHSNYFSLLLNLNKE